MLAETLNAARGFTPGKYLFLCTASRINAVMVQEYMRHAAISKGETCGSVRSFYRSFYLYSAELVDFE
jgi:hypothetical protein